MRIIISPRAEKELIKIPKIDQLAIARKIKSIKTTTFTGQQKLSGFKNIFRIRTGCYRIVYRKTPQEIYIVLISHRKDIYRLISQLFR